MKVFRCQICGDTYLGEKKPANCPFCGAHEYHIVLSQDYRVESNPVLSGISRRNLEEALRIEVANAQFYKSSASVSQDAVVKGMFKALSKIEAEHASVHSKLLEIEDYSGLYPADACGPDDAANLEESLRREKNAVERYSLFAGQAVEPRVRQIFEALAEIEKDHVELDLSALKTRIES